MQYLTNYVQLKRLELQHEEAKLPSIESAAKQGKDSPAYLSQLNKIQGLKSMLEIARTSSRDAVYERVMASDLQDRKRELEAKRTALAAKREFLKYMDDKYKAKRLEMVNEGGITRHREHVNAKASTRIDRAQDATQEREVARARAHGSVGNSCG